MRHGVDSSYELGNSAYLYQPIGYSQIREIRSTGQLPSGRRETGAEIRNLPYNTGDLATLGVGDTPSLFPFAFGVSVRAPVLLTMTTWQPRVRASCRREAVGLQSSVAKAHYSQGPM